MTLFAGGAAAAEPSFDEQFQAARRLASAGKREEALAAYTAMLKRSPENSDVLLARGRLYGWMDRWKESEEDLIAATWASPTYGDAWSALGDMFRWTDRPSQAAAAYKRWSEVAPKDPAPHLARGRALRLAGDPDGARKEYEAARSLGAPKEEVEKGLDALRPPALAPEATVSGGYHWTASVNASKEWVSGGGHSDYRDYSASLRRHCWWGSLAIEALGVHRFEKDDTAYALDGYFGLWDRAYANVREQYTPQHTLFPRDSGRVEIYQGVGQGWEFAASDDWLNFTSSSVNIYGVAVAKYFGNYYARARTTLVEPGDSVGWRLTLRDYYRGDADTYFEVNAGTGRGNYTTPGGVTSLQWSKSVSAAWVTFFTPRWGLKIAGDYSDSDHTERGVSATVYTRW